MKAPRNKINEPLIAGCNYHTTWQKNKGMRFVLDRIINNKAYLKTRTTNKSFKTNVDDLIFIRTSHNINKGIRLFKINTKN